MRTNTFKILSISSITLWLTFFCMLPVLLILSLCFFSANEATIFSLPLTFNNFKLLTNPYFYKIIYRSLLTASLSTFLCFVIAYPFSYFLTQAKHSKFLLLLVLIPCWTNSLIKVYALIGLLKAHGLINNLLMSMNLIHTPLDMLYNQTAVMIGLTYNLLPFMILPLYYSFSKLEPTLIAAAKDLNASRYYIFTKIIWPLSLPGIKNSLLMVFFPAMTTFYIPSLLGGANALLLGNLIENQFFLLNDWPAGATTSVIMIVLMLLFTSLLTHKKSPHHE